MPRILVPRNPGILCALGLLLTDLRTNFATTRLSRLGPETAPPRPRRSSPGLAAQADAWFDAEGIARRRAAPAPHGRHALPGPELRAAGRRARGADRARGARRAGRRLRRTRTSSCTASPRTRSRSRSSPSGSRRSAFAPKAEFRPHAGRGPGRRRRARRQPRRLAPGGRRLRALPGLRPRAPARRQPHRRPGDRRADGRDHAAPARHDRPRSSRTST